MKKYVSAYLLALLVGCWGIAQAQATSSYVIWSRNNHIWRMSDAGASKAQLTSGDDIDRHPSVCSKERKILFDRDDDLDPDCQNCKIYIMNKSGGDLENLSDVELPSFSNGERPDCGLDGIDYGGNVDMIAFAEVETPGNYSSSSYVWTMALDGSNPIPEVDYGYSRDPAWCWERGIAFSGPTSETTQQRRIFTWDTDIDHETKRTEDTVPASDAAKHTAPTCSANGQFLVYERFAGGDTDVFRKDLEEEEPSLGVDLTSCYSDPEGFYHTFEEPGLAPGGTYMVFSNYGYEGTDSDYEISKAPSDACDDSADFPVFLTGCAPQGTPGTPQCGVGPHPVYDNSDLDNDPAWGEL